MPFLHKRVGTAPGSFGETLRELRELRGFSVEELSRLTGIHSTIIRALEEERIDELLDPRYAERHIRALAKALDGRPSYILEKYDALLASRGVTREHEIVLRPRVRKRDLFVSSRVIALAGFVVFACIVGIYVAWQAKLIASVPSLDVVSPSDGLMVTEPRVVVQGTTDPAAFVDVNGSQVVVDSGGHFSFTLDIPRGLTTVHVESHRRFGSSAVIERHVIYERTTSTSSTPPLQQ